MGKSTIKLQWLPSRCMADTCSPMDGAFGAKARSWYVGAMLAGRGWSTSYGIFMGSLWVSTDSTYGYVNGTLMRFYWFSLDRNGIGLKLILMEL